MSAITLFTVTGRALLAAAVANGQALASAKLAVGDGNGQVYVPNENQTTLVHETWRGAASIARTDDLVVFQATIPANIGDFVVREVGLFLGTAGAEQLFIISQSPSREKIATPANGGAPMTVSIHFSANAAQVAVLPTAGAGVAILQLENTPHITVDALVTAPPANPVDGSIYAIGNAATGLFTGMGQKLVERVSGAWVFRAVRNRSVIRLKDTGEWYEKTDAGWVICTFNDPSVAWTEVNGKPLTFPPDPHNHDERYVRLASVSTARQSVGPLSLSAGDTNAAPVGGALSGLFIHNGDLAYGLRMGVVAGDGRTWFQAGRVDGVATYYNIIFNPLGGNASVGVANPVEKFEVAGNVKATRGKVEAVDFLAAGGATNWTAYQDANTWTLHSYSRGGTVLALTKEGAVGLCGDVGVTGRVIASQGSGQPAAWALPLDLISAADLRTKIGGPTIWAAVNCWGAKPANGGVPGTLLARGCTVTTNEISSGSPVMVVTFSTPAPNASYVVMPDNGRVSSKTANGFTYGLSDLGGLAASIVDLEVYL